MEALFTPFAIFFTWINNIHNPFLFILPIALITFSFGIYKNFSLRRYASMFPLWLLILSFVFGGLFIISSYPILINPGLEYFIQSDKTPFLMSNPSSFIPVVNADYSSTLIPANQLFITLSFAIIGFVVSLILIAFNTNYLQKNLKILLYTIIPFVLFSLLISAWYLLFPGAIYQYAYDAILVPFVIIYNLAIALTWITARVILLLRTKLSNNIFKAILGIITLISLSILVSFSILFKSIDNIDSKAFLKGSLPILENSCERGEHWSSVVCNTECS